MIHKSPLIIQYTVLNIMKNINMYIYIFLWEHAFPVLGISSLVEWHQQKFFLIKKTATLSKFRKKWCVHIYVLQNERVVIYFDNAHEITVQTWTLQILQYQSESALVLPSSLAKGFAPDPPSLHVNDNTALILYEKHPSISINFFIDTETHII